MNFDQFSEKYLDIKSPLSESEKGNSSGFLDYLAKEEHEAKSKYRRMYILYGIGAIVYLSVFVINPDPELSILNRIAGVCFIVAFSILVVISRKRFNEINSPGFLYSPKNFLKYARQRHAFWNKYQIWLIPVLLLVNAGATISLLDRLGNLKPFTGIVLIQLVFWILMAFAFYMGKKNWTKNKLPILRKIDQMLAGFEEQ